MTIYYAGTSIADLHAATGCLATTSATFIDTAFVREGIQLPLGGGGNARVNFTALAEGWIHYRYYFGAIGNNAPLADYEIVKLFGTSFSLQQPLFRILYTDGGTQSNTGWGYGVLQYWNGASYTAVNSETFLGIGGGGAVVQVDINFKMHDSTGFFIYYIGGAEIYRFSGDTIRTAATTIDRVEISGNNSAVFHYVSEIIVADTDTRTMRVVSLAPTGNGANTAWTGAFGDVDETGIGDNDFITSATANDVETYTMGDIPSGTDGYGVRAVVASARARKGTSGPLNLQGAVRISTTDYFSGNVTGLDTGYGPVQAIWATSPATATLWTVSEVNGLEMGLKSIT